MADAYRFGRFELLASDRRLLRDGRPVDVAPKVFDTLLVLLQAEGRVVSKRELTEAVWPDTFVVENSLTKNISALRRLLGDDTIETVPKFGYRIRLTPPVPPRRRSRSRIAIPGLIAVGLAIGLAADFARQAVTDAAPLQTVVVEPLRILRATESEHYLADAIAAAIRNQLASRHDVIVRDKPPADALVRGTLQTDRDTVDVFVEIVDTRRHVITWSRNFSMSTSEGVKLQTAIAWDVAGQLSHGVAPAERTSIVIPDGGDETAKAEYFRARDLLDRRADTGDATAYLEAALRRDPNLAVAWAALAEARSHPPFGTPENVQKAIFAARRSLAIDPNVAEAYATLGFIELFYRWNWRAAEQQLREALRRKPDSARFNDWLAIALLPRGRIVEARRAIERAHALDPASIDIATDMALIRYLARDFAGAERAARELVTRAPGEAVSGRGLLATTLAATARYDEALTELARLTPVNTLPQTRAALRYRAGASEERAHVLTALADPAVLARADNCDEIAHVYALIGEDDRAMEWLERAYAHHEFALLFLGADPIWDRLRGREDFQDLIRRLRINT